MTISRQGGFGRRRMLGLGAAGALSVLGAPLVGAVGCGSPGGSRGADGDAGDSAGEAGAGFPLTVDHLFGETRIEAAPRRVVALGGGDMEAAIAVGVVPKAGADWFGFRGTRGWVRGAIGDAKAPEPLDAGKLSYESVALAEPDVIFYVNSQNEEKVYRRLAEIAPTVAAPPSVENVYGVRWQDQLGTIARVLGRAERGRRVRSETEERLAGVRERRPQYAGKTITAGVFNAGRFSVWLPSDPRMRLLSALGFELNEKIAALDNGDFYVDVAPERLPLLESDLIFLAALDADGRLDPTLRDFRPFQRLATVRAGHVAYWPGPATILSGSEAGEFASALSIGGPLGIAYAVEKIVPMLDEGLAGAR